MSLGVGSEILVAPTDQPITRFDHCPCFVERKSMLAADPICWFCKFAEFDLFSDKLPECGVCRHPENPLFWPVMPKQNRC